MKYHFITLGVSLFFISPINSFHIDNIGHVSNRPIQSSYLTPHASKFFVPVNQQLHHEKIATSPAALLQAAKDTLLYIKTKQGKSRQILEPYQLKHIITFKQVEETLKFIISTIEKDKKTGKFRILDPAFINKNFAFVKWKADKQSALSHHVKIPSNGNIRLTNYVIYCVKGNTQKTTRYNCALYKLLDKSLAKKFTKQQILAGIFEKPEYKNKVKPLVWLTRDSFEEVLLQGTALVKMPDQSYKIFMVDTCNGINYIKRIKNTRKQQRYWYCREAKSNITSIEAFKKRIKLRKKVIFAGDINNIGIGKLIALRHLNPITQKQELHLGVLADTGGAFINNLYQLDLFLGMFNDKKTLQSQQMHFPNSTQAFLLYKRS
jgi:hypothetical protein